MTRGSESSRTMTLEMMALSNQGQSCGQIAKRFGVSHSVVIGRLTRMRAALAKVEVPPSASAKAAARQGQVGMEQGQARLAAGNTGDRGAYLDGLIWSRRAYLNTIRDEGGLSGCPTASLLEGGLSGRPALGLGLPGRGRGVPTAGDYRAFILTSRRPIEVLMQQSERTHRRWDNSICFGTGSRPGTWRTASRAGWTCR